MIRVLPPEVINQIAAGEVVERPFSVVKELVENALDAGATRVEVELVEGGRESIVVRDDGAGFEPEDLPLAFVGHATSKLSELRDLEFVASLGFRGEALASIGSVSTASIRSRRHDREEGFEVRCEQGQMSEVKPCGCPPGTRIEVHGLFAAIPARRRFLKTPRAERARIQDLLARLSLSRLDVAFKLRGDDRVLLDLPSGDDLKARVTKIAGRAMGDAMVSVRSERDDLVVEGLAGLPDAARRDSQWSLLYVNGRLCSDRAALHAIKAAYQGYLVHGRQPVWVLMLSIPPSEVDVNVHPQKSEVRFADSRRITGFLHRAVTDAIHDAGLERHAIVEAGGDRPRAQSGFPALPNDLFARVDRSTSPKALPTSGPGRAELVSETGDRPKDSLVSEAAAAAGGAELVREHSSEPVDSSDPADSNDDPFWRELGSRHFLRVLDLYLVFESPDGLVVVDQHALHERILFERFLRRAKLGESVQVQRNLIPDVVELSARDKEWLLEHRELLSSEGFEFEDFGGQAIAIHAAPLLLGKVRGRRLVEELLGSGDDPLPKARDALIERFHSKACRAAVMAGDRLSDQEIRELLIEASRCEEPSRCPHGRPTVLTFPPSELERYFGRSS